MKAKYYRFKEIKEGEIIAAHGEQFYPLDLINKLYEYYLSIDDVNNVNEIIILPSILTEFEDKILAFLIKQAHFDRRSEVFIKWLGRCSFYCEENLPTS